MSGVDLGEGKEKKIGDPEFRGYRRMHELLGRPNKWIYFSPCNRFAILVDIMTGDVLFMMDRKTKEQLYQSPKAREAARELNIVRILGGKFFRSWV